MRRPLVLVPVVMLLTPLAPPQGLAAEDDGVTVPTTAPASEAGTATEPVTNCLLFANGAWGVTTSWVDENGANFSVASFSTGVHPTDPAGKPWPDPIPSWPCPEDGPWYAWHEARLSKSQERQAAIESPSLAK